MNRSTMSLASAENILLNSDSKTSSDPKSATSPCQNINPAISEVANETDSGVVDMPPTKTDSDSQSSEVKEAKLIEFSPMHEAKPSVSKDSIPEEEQDTIIEVTKASPIVEVAKETVTDQSGARRRCQSECQTSATEGATPLLGVGGEKSTEADSVSQTSVRTEDEAERWVVVLVTRHQGH